ncbi:MAG: SMP-30/gluconolactonase/LRE family protein [Planctomycetes bacterium]|nr:SMP-30/gluconolactonase/LRE family protein [Planctomycetota bacterium]
MKLEAEPVLRHRANLGEGALWSVRDQVLYWVDIMEQKVMAFDPKTGRNRAWPAGSDVGTVVTRESGGLMLAVRDGFASMDLKTKKVSLLAEKKIEGVRFNDGKCDPAGRFWAGTMAYQGTEGAGSLYCLEKDLTVRCMIERVTISNGLVWTSDRRTFYYIDTVTYQVAAYDYDMETGNISRRRVAVELPRDGGGPDGMAIDEEDMLWVALWGGGQVARWNPRTGKLIGKITAPSAKQVTSCAFGGPGLKDLYITTASIGLSPEALKEQATAGCLFHAAVDVRGAASFSFAG